MNYLYSNQALWDHSVWQAFVSSWLSVLRLIIQVVWFSNSPLLYLSHVFICSFIFFSDLSLFSSTLTRKGSVDVESPLWRQAVQKLQSEVVAKDYNTLFRTIGNFIRCMPILATQKIILQDKEKKYVGCAAMTMLGVIMVYKVTSSFFSSLIYLNMALHTVLSHCITTSCV